MPLPKAWFLPLHRARCPYNSLVHLSIANRDLTRHLEVPSRKMGECEGRKRLVQATYRRGCENPHSVSLCLEFWRGSSKGRHLSGIWCSFIQVVLDSRVLTQEDMTAQMGCASRKGTTALNPVNLRQGLRFFINKAEECVRHGPA